MIPVGIVAHPDRRDLVSGLAKQVEAEVVSWDSQSQGCTANHRQLWSYLAICPDPWVVILEDDAKPCRGFRTQLMQALIASPSSFVSLYLGRGRPDQWQLPISSIIAQEACFIRSDTLLATVGYAIRTPLLPELDKAVGHSCRSGLVELPHAITLWAQRHDTSVCYTRPSLVDHLNVPTVNTAHPASVTGEY